MRFHSLTQPSLQCDLPTAILQGLAPDRGLYFPNELPDLGARTFLDPGLQHPAELGTLMLAPFVVPHLSRSRLEALLHDALDFPLPLVEPAPGQHVLELFHGPTAAFKDVGARVMARLLSALHPPGDDPLTVLVATSGDTGSAVAQGFLQMPGIRVVILYPGGRISPLQERQLTSAGHNVFALEVDGSFDACQTLVKNAFLDTDLRSRCALTSANSINVARWMPQAIYYGWATRLLGRGAHFVVPSGNLGNLAAGVLAMRLGMPAAGFSAASNANDVYPRFLAGGDYVPRASVATLSNAMDVGDPSNKPRLDALFRGDASTLRKWVRGFSLDDLGTRHSLARTHEDWGYLACPHTAVALAHARDLASPPSPASPTPPPPRGPLVTLATAHPAKFTETVHAATGVTPPLPASLAACLTRPTARTPIPARYEALREWLLTPPV